MRLVQHAFSSRTPRQQVTQAQSLRPVRKDAMQERQRNRTEKLPVLRLISACVESNVSLPLLWSSCGGNPPNLAEFLAFLKLCLRDHRLSLRILKSLLADQPW